MPKQMSATPTRKVIASTAGAGLASAIVILIKEWVEISDEATGALVTLVTFALGYFIPPAASDQVHVNGEGEGGGSSNGNGGQ